MRYILEPDYGEASKIDDKLINKLLRRQKKPTEENSMKRLNRMLEDAMARELEKLLKKEEKKEEKEKKDDKKTKTYNFAEVWLFATLAGPAIAVGYVYLLSWAAHQVLDKASTLPH